METTKHFTTQSVTESFGSVRIDDLFFTVEKTTSLLQDGNEWAMYQIVIFPKAEGIANSYLRSAGSAIESDEEAIEFLKRLEELKTVLSLSSF